MSATLIIQLITALASLVPEMVQEVQALLPTIEKIIGGQNATEADVQALDGLVQQLNAKVAALGG